MLAEIEGVLNPRPLTYLDSDLSEEHLTPAHLVLGKRLVTLPSLSEILEALDQDIDIVQRRTIYFNTLLDHFWSRCSKVWFWPSLRELHSCESKDGGQRKVHVGDVVLVRNDQLPRSQ